MDKNIYNLTKFERELKEHKLEEEERLVQFLSEKYGYPYLSGIGTVGSAEALQTVKEEDAKLAEMAVFKRIDKDLHIAIKNPNNKHLKEVLAQLKRDEFAYSLYMASTKTVNNFWEYYKDIISTSATMPGLLDIDNEQLEKKLDQIKSIEDVSELIKELEDTPSTRRTSKNIEYIVFGAIALGASDIHLEPTTIGGVVRYRVDGILYEMADYDEKDFKGILTRMQLLSGMKVMFKPVAQDGTFLIKLKGKEINARSSVIPEKSGAFVIRLLDPTNVITKIDSLGFHPVLLKEVKEQIVRPNGMVITTGPTGSGKTTTLYSFLNLVKSKENKVITLEDPIEYRLEGIVQTQIEKGYSFASGLRAILRQDPDIILVGEIRDEEVAEVGINAALTGHLVFSTLHTNDAVGALPRLKQLGIDPILFSSAINLIMAQRLVRKLCPDCSKPATISEEEKVSIQKVIEDFPSGYEKKSVAGIREPGEGCKTCNNGYKGRIGVLELFRVTDEVSEIIAKNEGIVALKKEIKAQGFPLLIHDAVEKVISGVTSMEEIKRVFGTIKI